jgi:hypothetical protein
MTLAHVSAVKQETRPDRKEIETNSPATRHYWFLWGSLKIIDGLLYKEFHKHDDTGHFQNDISTCFSCLVGHWKDFYPFSKVICDAENIYVPSKLLEIRKTRTSPRNPRGNGQIERFNRSLLSMIKSFLRGEQTGWDLNLGCLADAYRATPHESTGLTPIAFKIASLV